MSARNPILVIDDDEDIRDVLEMALESMGYCVEQAGGGAEALRLMEDGPKPSLVLLDMMMPDMDGEAVLSAMRRAPALADIPVVLVTGHAAAQEKALELNAASALVKPIQYDELASTVERFATPRL